jgi:hypothetical protein
METHTKNTEKMYYSRCSTNEKLAVSPSIIGNTVCYNTNILTKQVLRSSQHPSRSSKDVQPWITTLSANLESKG